MIFRFLLGNLEFAEVKPKIEQLMSQYTFIDFGNITPN